LIYSLQVFIAKGGELKQLADSDFNQYIFNNLTQISDIVVNDK